MSNIIQEALKNCTTIPEDSDTQEILKFFADFIKCYGIFLTFQKTLSFKFLITGHRMRERNVRTYQVILTTPHPSYGNFSVILEEEKLTPFGGSSLANLLSNNGAKVTFDEKASKADETYDHYFVEFNICQ